LNKTQDEIEFSVYVGLKHITPFIEEAVEKMNEDGIKEVVSIVLAPHYSTFSVKSYNERAKEEAEKYGISITSVDSWYKQPKFIQYWTEKIRGSFDGMNEAEREKACLIVSAHSLPEKIKQFGDPYPEQLEETAKMIAEAAEVKNYAV